MNGWQETTLGEIVRFKAGTGFPKDLQGERSGDFPFAKVSDMNSAGNEITLSFAENYISRDQAASLKAYIHQPGSIAFAKIGIALTTNRRRQVTRPIVLDNNMMSAEPDGNRVDPKFAYYLLLTIDFNEVSAGSALPYLTVGGLKAIPVNLPELPEQREIAAILGALDDKIELNRKTAATLEEMARALYRSWFVDFDPVWAKSEGRTPAYMDEATAALFPDSFGEDGLPVGWEEIGLSEIATFLNGAALQKFPAEGGEESLPVIKIAELRGGITAKSGRASKATLPDKYRVSNGDVLFSWSGSLLQKVWTEGDGALNQHLFKVSSDRVPKWFHYYAVDQHMEEFRQIAQSKATTMGHIQRHHLDSALVCLPTPDVMSAADAIVAPLFAKIVALHLENQTLASLQDTLLPKLMSGELRVGEAQELVEEIA